MNISLGLFSFFREELSRFCFCFFVVWVFFLFLFLPGAWMLHCLLEWGSKLHSAYRFMSSPLFSVHVLIRLLFHLVFLICSSVGTSPVIPFLFILGCEFLSFGFVTYHFMYFEFSRNLIVFCLGDHSSILFDIVDLSLSFPPSLPPSLSLSLSLFLSLFFLV